MYIGDAQAGKIYLGDVLISGADNGYMLGELESAETAKTITITDIGNYYLQSETLIADLQDMWDWDSDSALTWGSFYLDRSGNNTLGLLDAYTATMNTYGGGVQISERNTGSVKVVKSDKAILIDLSSGVIVLFSAMDSNGVERKCAALARDASSSTIYFAADDGISANVKQMNRNTVRTTTSLYELTPFFDELSSGFVKDDTVLAVRSYPYPGTLANGLYKIGDNQAYLSFFFGIKDV